MCSFTGASGAECAEMSPPPLGYGPALGKACDAQFHHVPIHKHPHLHRKSGSTPNLGETHDKLSSA